MSTQAAYTDPFPTRQGIGLGHIWLGGQKVPIRMHFIMPIYAAISVLSALRFGPTYAAFHFFTDFLVLFVTVFVHECGHSLAAIGVDGTCHSITLWPLGGFACVSHNKGPKEDIWVSLAGPLMHIPMVLFWYGIIGLTLMHPFDIRGIPCNIAMSQKCFWLNVCAAAGMLNIQLFCFNLFVPAYPLDCSRILVGLLGMCRVEVNRAAYIIAFVSLPIAMALLGYSIYLFVGTSSVSDMVTAQTVSYSIMFFLAIFLLFGAWGIYQAGRRGQAAMHPAFAHYRLPPAPVTQPVDDTWGRGRTLGGTVATGGGKGYSRV